ncbi:hypothetical protein AGR5A_Lc80081 [Agrobacterium genomosp. 5 str. CFBP 6626]|nr:hypothetical protein AGR5A_Lc80081 [Agrobacterium genomosp. 5 str. CFBP 6626]
MISELMRCSSVRFCFVSSTVSRSPIRIHWSAALSQNFAKAMGAMVGRLVVMNWPGRDAAGFFARPPSGTADTVVAILTDIPVATAKVFARRNALFAMSCPCTVVFSCTREDSGPFLQAV